MRFYPVPIEMEEEKTFGGILTIRQVVYIFATIIITVTAFLILKLLGVHIIANVMICTLLLMSGIALTFVTFGELRLDQYILFRARYYTRTKSFYLRGDAE